MASKLEKARAALAALRSRTTGIKPRELIQVARMVERRTPTKSEARGKEPIYISDRPGWFPLSIPNHPTLKPKTAKNIIAQLEHDIDLLELEQTKQKTKTGAHHAAQTHPHRNGHDTRNGKAR